jgi:hypothetical protein
METDNPEATLIELRRRSGGPLMPMSEALDRKSVFSGLFKPVVDLSASGTEKG